MENAWFEGRLDLSWILSYHFDYALATVPHGKGFIVIVYHSLFFFFFVFYLYYWLERPVYD